MPGNVAIDKMESVREVTRMFNEFIEEDFHTNEEYHAFVNAMFVTPERMNIINLLINKAKITGKSLSEDKRFKMLFFQWADKEFALSKEKLISEEAQIGLRLGGC